ncbi:hypothetical protein MYVA_2398 [Mycolicibacterium vaccae 95051]|nr:hypothetical protein MYVA_2398 [Mycolicibacterium vaccae 95051]
MENFGAGFWILHPADPITRIEHGLRWWLKNVRDSDNAVRDLARPDYQPLQRRLERIIDIGLAAGCDLQALNNRYFSTPVMEYANHHSSASNPQLIWKICSGFAHGRPWASIGMNHMERNGNDDERGVSEVRFTSDHKRLLGVALPAFRLMTDLVRLMQDRSVRRNLDTESVRRL